MYGQKEIISCMVIVTLVAILNYYKSIIKRDKEIQNARRALLEKQKMDELLLEAERAAFNREMFLKKMLEYSDRCYDIHALIYRPRDYDFTDENVPSAENNSTDTESDTVIAACDPVTESNEFVTLKEKDTMKKKNEKADASKIVYVLVAVLLGSLAKAALDLTKHYKKKDNNETENDILRRCSLQEYSLLKHKQRNQPKAFEIFSRKSITTQRSLDSGSAVAKQQQEHFMRRMSGNPQDYSNGSGFTTPGIAAPSAPGKLLAGRPAPLLRRCSVPTFAPPKHQSTFRQLRRPSMDSFSEDDLDIDFSAKLQCREKPIILPFQKRDRHLSSTMMAKQDD